MHSFSQQLAMQVLTKTGMIVVKGVNIKVSAGFLQTTCNKLSHIGKINPQWKAKLSLLLCLVG